MANSREFLIPLTRKEIIESSTSLITLNDLYKAKEIGKRIQTCNRKLANQDFNLIIESFDVFYSILHEWPNLSVSDKEDSWDLVLKSLKLALPSITETLDCTLTNKHQDPHKVFNNRNALKMIVYIISQIIECFEGDMNELEHMAAVNNLAKKGKRNTIDLKEYRIDWASELEILLSTLNILCQNNIQRLWNPPIVESNFINAVSFCFLKPIERKIIASNQNIRIAGARLLTTLIKKFNYSSSLAISLCQLLKRHNHIVPVLVTVTKQYFEDGSMPGAIRDLLNEICDYEIEDLEKDNTALNNVSQYLQDVASVHHSLALFIIPMIKPCLERDPYNMRICALSVIGDLLQTYKGRDNLEDKERAQRDKLIRKIFEHVHDVNAHVRARALVIIQSLVISRLIPVDMYLETIDLIKGENGAINDVSSIARKVAVKVLTALITHSPISTSINPKQLEEIIKKEKQSLESLRETLDTAENLKLAANLLANEEKSSEKGDEETPKEKKDGKGNEDDEEDEEEEDDDDEEDEDDAETNPSERRQRRKKTRLALKEKRDKIEKGRAQASAVLKKAFNEAYEDFKEKDSEPEKKDKIEQALADKEDELNLRIVRQETCIYFLEEMFKFSQSIPEIIADVQSVLVSKNPSDAVEAIHFFVTAKRTGILGINPIMSQIATLSWSGDESIRNAAVQAIKVVYLPDDEMRTQGDLLNVVNNLLELVQSGTRGDHISLFNTLSMLEKKGDLPANLSPFIWKELEDELDRYFTQSTKAEKDLKAISDSRKRSILLINLSSMLLKPSVQNLKSKLPLLMAKGLGIEWNKSLDINNMEDSEVTICSSIDLEFAKHVLALLEKFIPETQPRKENSDKTKNFTSQSVYRQHPNHVLFIGIKKIIISRLFSLRQPHFIPFVEQAINIIFYLADSADICAGDLLQRMVRKIDKSVANQQNNENLDKTHETIDRQMTQEPTPLSLPSFVLSRLFFTIGHIGMKLMIYLETDVLLELRMRNAEKPTEKKKPRKSIRKSCVNRTEIDDEEETGLTGATADDFEADLIREICETEIVSQPDRVSIASLSKIIIYACTYMNKSTDLEFQSISALSLAKLMLVSSSFCESNLRLLFTIAERHPSDIVRSNLVVALGDINRRFPNLMEPYTAHLYARLSDPSTKVKINTLNTISHLILNDMVRVKGQISAMAVCLLDDYPRIAQLARIFFKELGSKDNALYNVLPDIISRLSDEEQGGVSEEKFRLIVDYLFQQVQKDKQNENLVDKICARMKNNDNPRSCCDLAYCLKSMNFNERMFKTLQHHSGSYFDKLNLESVYESFVVIISKIRSAEKLTCKEELDDFEAKIEEIHRTGVSDEAALKRAEQATIEAAKKKHTKKPRATKTSTVSIKAEDIFNDDEEDDE